MRSGVAGGASPLLENGFSARPGGAWPDHWADVLASFRHLDDGISVELAELKSELKSLGNSLVPQIPEAIGLATARAMGAPRD